MQPHTVTHMHHVSCAQCNPYHPLLTLHTLTVSLFGYDTGVWPIMAVVTFPISFLKQMVSVLQLVVASQNIGALDAAARSRQQHS